MGRRTLLAGAAAGGAVAGAVGTVAGAAVAGACVRLWSSVLPRVLQGPGWQRTNHAGRTVSLVEGPAVVAGCGVAVAGSPAAGLAALAAGGLGLWDDLAGDTSTKGLRGHLRALTRGEVTTGALKVIGLGVVGLASAAATDRRVGLGTLAGAGVVAGTANLVNLFDLRPGRALKVTVLLGLPMAYGGGFGAGALLGTAVAALPEDLRGERMLGDTGANALGALAGALALEQLGTRGRVVALAALAALTLASERVSFTDVIAGHAPLRALDEWGRSAA
ncbi:hypothetical protein [Barrientosiimonas humi]|uniref:hypothetical protein n=1 Tax=Barrientosiimonas humi TaxID=999931 RepID=UPI00370D22D0